MSILRTDGLVKQYSGRVVVNRVDLELKKGEIVGLLGPNGAGKTTTFNMVVGITRPNAGSIFLDDRNITRYAMHQRARLGIGYLAQEKSVFRKLTVEQNIWAIAEILPIPRREKRRRAESVLEELGIGHLAKQPAYTCSGGERRRVEIARALVCEPDFILLDEPFSGVDPKAVEELQNVIYQMQQRGLGILITDHSVRETLTVTDRAYLIYEGQVLISGTAEDLVNDPKARQYYLGERFYMDTQPDMRKTSLLGSIFHRKAKTEAEAQVPTPMPTPRPRDQKPPAEPAEHEQEATPEPEIPPIPKTRAKEVKPAGIAGTPAVTKPAETVPKIPEFKPEIPEPEPKADAPEPKPEPEVSPEEDKDRAELERRLNEKLAQLNAEIGATKPDESARVDVDLDIRSLDEAADEEEEIEIPALQEGVDRGPRHKQPDEPPAADEQPEKEPVSKKPKVESGAEEVPPLDVPAAEAPAAAVQTDKPVAEPPAPEEPAAVVSPNEPSAETAATAHPAFKKTEEKSPAAKTPAPPSSSDAAESQATTDGDSTGSDIAEMETAAPDDVYPEGELETLHDAMPSEPPVFTTPPEKPKAAAQPPTGTRAARKRRPARPEPEEVVVQDLRERLRRSLGSEKKSKSTDENDRSDSF